MSHAETHYETYLIHRAEKAETKLQQVRAHIADNRHPGPAWRGRNEWDDGYDTACQDILDILEGQT